MARIRTLKPELASDAGLTRLSIPARYTFVLLITQADDYGLLAGSTRQLLGVLFPLDDDVSAADVTGWLQELEDAGLIRRRQTADGAPVVELANWAKHQRIDNAARSTLREQLAADEGEAAEDLTEVADSRGDSPRTAAEIRSRALDLGPRTKDKELGPRSRSVSRAGAREAGAPMLVAVAEGALRTHTLPKRYATECASALEELERAGVTPDDVREDLATWWTSMERQKNGTRVDPMTPAQLEERLEQLAARGPPGQEALKRYAVDGVET